MPTEIEQIKVEDSTRTVEYKSGYRYATNVAIFRIVEMWESAVRSALAINEMLPNKDNSKKT